MIAGLCNQKIRALVFEETCNSTLFETYIKDFLVKNCSRGK